MTRLDHLGPRTTMASRHPVRRGAHGPAGEARIRRSFDGVVASYIRELAAPDNHAPTRPGRETVAGGGRSVGADALRRVGRPRGPRA
jgi:hypothetical protein